MNKALIILGPTATGKTDLALSLADKFNGQLVACDSRQVYKGLDIGTGKLPSSHAVLTQKYNGYWEINGIKVWMYDLVDLAKQYTVADYVCDATKVINEIHSRRKLPIVVGGTGFYLKALLEGIDNLSVPVDQGLREELGKLNIEELQLRLQQLSPQKWKQLNDSDKKNSRRLLRAIEISMYPYKKTQNTNIEIQNWDIFKIGLTAPKEFLYQKVDFRIFKWFDNGIIDEVAKLIKQGVSIERFKQLGLEYGLIGQFLIGKIKTKVELIDKIKGELHSYVRRQQTWFKKEKDVNWFNITDNGYGSKIEKLIRQWYD